MENKLKISKDTVVYCSTYDLTKQVLTLVNSLGYYWCNHRSYLDESIHLCLSNVYYDFHSGQYLYEQYSYYKIITDIEFLKLHNMEERTVKISLDKAKEFYKQGGSNKELALLAFTEGELNDEILVPNNIKIYEDGTKQTLGIGFDKQILMYDHDTNVFGVYASSYFDEIKCKLVLCKKSDLEIGDVFLCDSKKFEYSISPILKEYYAIYLGNTIAHVYEDGIKVINIDNLKSNYYYYKVVPVNG